MSNKKNKLHVMQVVECGGPGGTGHQVVALCNGLDKNQFDISLVYSVRRGTSPQDYEAMAHGALHHFYVPEMVREITPILDIRAWRRLYAIFRECKPDIVHAHSSKAGFLARTAAWAAGIPKIYYSPRGYSFLQTDRSGLTRWLYRWLERSVSWIGETVAVSKSESARARELLACKIRVIRDAYLGQIPEPAQNGHKSPTGKILVCASGRMSFPRNPQAFVKLAQRLTDSRNNIRCLWIGGGELESVVLEMIRDLNLTGKLEVTGWLPHDKALELLQTADIFVHYSRWEGLSNSILEAMVHGLPIIASDIPENRDLIQNQENGFLAATEIELLERTLELIDRPDLRKTFGDKNQALARKEYTLKRLLREIADLYDPPTCLTQ